ncbi:MAG: hypothetical protein RBT64_04120 [Trichloromonas sp.]|jgi:hypothetical protein|nr:hypothetical protein [Trichloromonas sp.]
MNAPEELARPDGAQVFRMPVSAAATTNRLRVDPSGMASKSFRQHPGNFFPRDLQQA